MTAVENRSTAQLPLGSTTWECQQFQADGIIVACSADMSSTLSIDSDGSAVFAVCGSTVAGAFGAEGSDAVYVGELRSDAPWGTIAGSYEDRVCAALTGRLRCEYRPDRLTLSNGSAVLHFVPGR
jgi:hypothetical protein